jgi:hypothetical protein
VTEDSRVCSPFDTDVEDLADDISSITGLEEQFTDIQNDATNTNRITECDRDQNEKQKPNPRNEAVYVLLPFSAISLCEAGSSVPAVTRTKLRS